MKYARIVNNVAVDVRTESPDGCFTPNIVAEFVTVPDEIENGWTLGSDTWSAPAPVVPHVPTAEEIAAIELAAFKATVPATVSPRQIRQGLTAAGLRDGVETAVAAGSQDLKDWWEFATDFQRAHPMVIGMCDSLGVTERQADELWILAGSLV